MRKKTAKIFSLLILSIILSAVSWAQEQTGTIEGTIHDSEGIVLPGVTVTASSEAIMGTKSYISTETGVFRFPALPPGYYTITCACPGFKTLSRGNIVVRIGRVVTLSITMETATIEEEVTVTATSPTIDVKQTKISIVMDRDLLKDTPLARDIYDIVNAAPGAISEEVSYRRTTSVHGGTVRSNTYALDGVVMNDPVVMYPLTNINFDVMEEVELEVGAHPASVGYTDGAYINIVTRSGGNRFMGGATLYYTDNSLSQSLWTDEQVQAMGVTQPEVEKSWIDGSLSLGGPIINDRLWFFTNGRYIQQERFVSYIPWTDVLGRFHDKWDWIHEEWLGFMKLTTQITPSIKLMGMFNYVDRYRPVYQEPSPTLNFIETTIQDHERTYTGNVSLSSTLGQNTFFDLRASYVHRWFPVYMQKEAQDLPYITDYADNYGGLTSNSGFNQTILRKRFQTGLYLTRFQDNFFGGNHEFRCGAEFEQAYADQDRWRKDNLSWIWFGNPYYYGNNVGVVTFRICGAEEGSTIRVDKLRRIGIYIQDSATFANRLTLNVGIRYDRSWGWQPGMIKGASGNPLSVWLGENIVSPYIAKTYPDRFPDGLNPWGELSADEWRDIMVWDSWSPRIGLTYDIFGNGKTALKASFSRYTEYLMIQYFTTLHPFYPTSFAFYWVDTNYNGQIEQTDAFSMMPTDFRVMDFEFSKSKLDPDTTSPLTDEFTVGIWHELLKDVSLGLNFIYKRKKNILEDALYSPDTDEWWNSMDQPAAQKYWVPFNTTVPSEVYGDVDVTFYASKLPPDGPSWFSRLANIPDLKRKYWAIELLFNKRMASGWQFAGSLIYSKAYGNIGGWYNQSWGWSGAADTPNSYVNTDGRLDIDRPFQIKLMATAQLPYRIFLSAFYRFFSGAPWVRLAYIRPPSSWTSPQNLYRTFYYVFLENPGLRRHRSTNQLDLRLEKEFWFGDFGKLSFYIDVFNALGWTDIDIDQNDVYRWQPVGEGFGQPGSLTMNPSYQHIFEVMGRRTVKFSMRFSF